MTASKRLTGIVKQAVAFREKQGSVIDEELYELLDKAIEHLDELRDELQTAGL